MSIYKLSFKNFKRRKLRSALTMLGIIIGVTALVVLMGLGSGIKTYATTQTESMMGDITIMNSSAASYMGSSGDYYLKNTTVNKIKSMPQLYNIKEETQFSSSIKNTPIYVVGISDWSQVKMNGTPGVVINDALVDRFGYKIGDNITIKDKDFVITGITKEKAMGMGIVYLNVDKALPLNEYKVSMVSANSKVNPNDTKKEIEAQISGVSAMTKSDFSSQIDTMMNGLMLFVGLIASIALLVGVISIINIMLVNVSERTREIGVLKAIGFTNREVLGSILAEAAILGFIASILGVIVAAILMQIGIILFASQLGMEDIQLMSMLPLWLILGVIGGSTFLSVLAGLYPAWRASRLNVVEALRYE
ncbi:MAG: ABC transporter permease [Methanobacterium sp.]|uniref:ABC transporter permease n=1 Tax=Methanobacterium sp. TaxID=2164 RepID=UPI003D65E260|nr:ABC transporter permease [Methanobacterium sp.]